MEVRLLKHWNGFRPGKILCEAPDGMAGVLVKRGMAEPVAAEPKQAAAENPAPPKKRKAPKAAAN
jgi:hypothetical protein